MTRRGHADCGENKVQNLKSDSRLSLRPDNFWFVLSVGTIRFPCALSDAAYAAACPRSRTATYHFDKVRRFFSGDMPWQSNSRGADSLQKPSRAWCLSRKIVRKPSPNSAIVS